ncbi:MAG TPA: rubrerythrin family protein [Candidatus Eisenbacteria bacterium]|nr:rubrerythrin family protein [Candidatus Eisenbacteria bacterium]
MVNLLRTLLSLVVPAIVPSRSGTVSESTTTLDNLQTAFNGESNAEARDLAFARKADEEGYSNVAGLFRAAAKAEAIHARNHAAVIEKMGAVPAVKLGSVEVKTTRKNLIAATEGEKYERDTMYPEFIEAARRDNAKAAIRSFTYALKVEAVHAVLYQDALDNLEKRKGKGHTYYVCPDCGNTLEDLTILKCLICGHSRDGFLAVN